MDNLAVEGFILQGLSGESKRYNNATIDINLQTSYGLAIRPFMNVNEAVELYGRLGTVKAKNKVVVTSSTFTETLSDSTTHSLYGAGLAYKLADNMKVVFDYTKLSTKNDAKSSLISVGVRYNF